MVQGTTKNPRPGMVVGMVYGGKASRPGVVLAVDAEAGIVRIIFGTTKPARARSCILVEKGSRDGREMGLKIATNFCREEVSTRTVDEVEKDGERWGWCPAGLLADLVALA